MSLGTLLLGCGLGLAVGAMAGMIAVCLVKGPLRQQGRPPDHP